MGLSCVFYGICGEFRNITCFFSHGYFAPIFYLNIFLQTHNTQASKFFFGAAAQHYKEFLPPLVASLKEIDLRVKYSAERALKHLCEGITTAEAASGVAPGQSALLTQYLTGLSSGTSNASAAEKEAAVVVRDFMRRVMPGLPAESDNEGDN